MNKQYNAPVTFKEFKGFMKFSIFLWENYKHELKVNRGLKPKEMFKHTEPDKMISAAFTWSQSTQGYEYWAEMNIAWQAYLKRTRG